MVGGKQESSRVLSDSGIVGGGRIVHQLWKLIAQAEFTGMLDNGGVHF